MQDNTIRIDDVLQDDRYDLRAEEREAVRDEMIMEPRAEYPAPRRQAPIGSGQEGGEVGW